MDVPKECLRSLQILGIHRILLVLHTGLLTNHPTLAGPYEASDGVALGRQGTARVRNIAGQDGQQTYPATT